MHTQCTALSTCIHPQHPSEPLWIKGSRDSRVVLRCCPPIGQQRNAFVKPRPPRCRPRAGGAGVRARGRRASRERWPTVGRCRRSSRTAYAPPRPHGRAGSPDTGRPRSRSPARSRGDRAGLAGSSDRRRVNGGWRRDRDGSFEWTPACRGGSSPREIPPSRTFVSARTLCPIRGGLVHHGHLDEEAMQGSFKFVRRDFPPARCTWPGRGVASDGAARRAMCCTSCCGIRTGALWRVDANGSQ